MKSTISFDAPYKFEYSLDYFSRSDKEIVDLRRENSYRRVLDIQGKPMLVIVKPLGPAVMKTLEIHIPGCRSARRMAEMAKSVTRILSLDQDIRPYYRQVSGDKVLNKLSKGQYGLKPPTTPTIFEALVWAILGQQLNLSFIYSLKAKVAMRYGSRCHFNSRRYYGFPSPEELSTATYNELRGMQLSRRKAEYIMGLCRDIVKGKIDLKDLTGLSDEEALQKLMKIKGVGRWTAEYVLLRGLGRWEVIPADDIGIRNAVTHFYNYKKQVDAKEVRRLAETWGDYKGCAAFYLQFAYHKQKNRGANPAKK